MHKTGFMNLHMNRPLHAPAHHLRWLGVVLLMGLACSTGALAADLPKSPECRSALQALDQEEAEMAAQAKGDVHNASGGARKQVADIHLRPLRERVARECLGGLETGPSPSQHTWVAPTSVRPVMPVAPAMPLARKQPQTTVPTAPFVPPPRFEPPVTIANCVGGTCLTSDGSRLTRVGPNLVGPRGTCMTQGAFVRCP